MASTNETNVGALITLTAPEDGENTWVAKQLEVARSPKFPGDERGRVNIDWSIGPIKVSGYVDTGSFEIAVSISVVGINLGVIYGNLREGVVVKIDLFVAKGSLRFYLKNGNEVWIHVDVKIIFDGSFQGDYKIITI